jgi:thioredoxin reductase (NADPH)
MTTNELFDITVIGGGPIGIYTTYFAGLRGAKVKLIESLGVLGGQPQMMYPEKKVYDIPGLPALPASELIQKLIEQMEGVNPTVQLSEKVLDYTAKEDGTFVIETTRGTHFTKSIIIAAGNGAFLPNPIGLEEEEKLHHDGKISYAVNNKEIFKGKNIAIAGGGDSAVDWALELESIANDVLLIHRRDKFRAHEKSIQRLDASSVDKKTPFLIQDITGKGEGLEIQVKNIQTNDIESYALDHLLVNFGFKSNIAPINSWNLELDEKNKLIVKTTLETSQKGIFGVGNIASYDGKIQNITTGFGEVPIAINAAMTYYDPDNNKTKQY